MNIVIDMNLSPTWVPRLQQAGHTVVHWSFVGAPDAPDREILAWARGTEHIVFTHDLDFGAILAATDAEAPSVVQVRTQHPTPEHCGDLVQDILRRYAAELSLGALISVDEERARVRLFPLRREEDGAERAAGDDKSTS